MKYLFFILLFFSTTIFAQPQLTENAIYCELHVIPVKQKQIFIADCFSSQWIFTLNKYNQITDTNYESLFIYKNHLICLTSFDKNYQFAYHSPLCPICNGIKIPLHNIKELTETSANICDTYIKQFLYKGHLICRARCSDKYFGFHPEWECNICKNKIITKSFKKN